MRPLPTLRQLAYLCALAEHRHFGRAAEACAVTQSTLSAAIQDLEQVLGGILVERGKRKVLLTPLGEEVLGRGRAMLRQAEDLLDLGRAAQAPLSGPLRLGVIPTIAPFLLPRVLPRLHSRYPQLRLTLREDLSARQIDMLDDGQIDAALLALPYPLDGMTVQPLGEDPFLLAGRPDHPLLQPGLALPDGLSPAMLAAGPLLLLDDGHCLRDHALAACALAGGQLGDGVRGTSLPTLVMMVAAGQGVTLLPKMAVVSGMTRSFGLQVQPLAAGAPARQIALIWRQASPRAAEFRLLGTEIRADLTAMMEENHL